MFGFSPEVAPVRKLLPAQLAGLRSIEIEVHPLSKQWCVTPPDLERDKRYPASVSEVTAQSESNPWPVVTSQTTDGKPCKFYLRSKADIGSVALKHLDDRSVAKLIEAFMR